MSSTLLLLIINVAKAGAWTNVDLELDPKVPLTHCARFGRSGQFTLEWQLTLEPKNHLEARFTSDVQRGFSAFGFTERDHIQLVTGYPVEQLPCAQQLLDNHSPFDINGNLYPSFPELPGKEVFFNDTHVSHYVMRNISTNAQRMLHHGASMPTNITIVWAYMQSSLFNGACYIDNLAGKVELANFEVLLNDPEFLKIDGMCKSFGSRATAHRMNPRLDHGPEGRMLDGEFHQNFRVAALLFGGGLLLDSGRRAPLFEGKVLAGDNMNGLCSSSRTRLFAGWFGFSDPIGGIARYLVSFGTLELPSLFADRIDVGTLLSWELEITEPMAPNASYIVTVTALNYAELQTVVTSRPARVLNDGRPIHGTIQDGLGEQDLQFQRETGTLSARWDRWLTEERATQDYHTRAFTDNGFDYAVGELGVDVDSVQAWTHVAVWANEVTVTGLMLMHGTTYTISVRATNCAGTFTTATTNGVTIDIAPPVPGTVLIGNHTWKHTPFLFLSQHLEARWFGFVDTLSGVVEYRWAMSTYPYAPDVSGNSGMVMGWSSVGSSLYARSPTSLWQMPNAPTLLPIGAHIFVHLKAIDGVGNFVIKTSNATQIVGH